MKRSGRPRAAMEGRENGTRGGDNHEQLCREQLPMMRGKEETDGGTRKTDDEEVDHVDRSP